VSKSSASKKFMPAVWIVAIAAVAAIGFAGLRVHTRRAASAEPQPGHARASMGTLPLAFEANQGQTDPTVKYIARGSGYTVFLTESDAVLALHSAPTAGDARAAGRYALGVSRQNAAEVRAEESQTAQSQANDQNAAIRLNLIGGNAHPQIAASSPLPGHSNYFIGNDRSQWHANVAQFARVSYRNVYPGVDMAFYGGEKQLEFDFIVAPGASASPIRLGVLGADHIASDDSGNLVLASTPGNVLLRKPVAYQEKDGVRQPVEVLFVQHAARQVSFVLGNYDHSRELVIDPSVSYATYLGGGAEDDAYGIAIDGNGDAYVTGQTASTDFPAVGGVQSKKKAEFDAFVTKISADGSTLIYSTYVGGNGEDSGNAIAVDGSGNAFVAGGTGSSNFPNSGGYQTSLKGSLDAFVFELNSTGTALTYSTFLGGSKQDFASGIAVLGGNAYVVGQTQSSDFPTENPLQSNIAGTANGFVTELNSSGSALVYSTYLGGGTGDFAAAVAVDSSGNAYVTGASQNSTFPHTTGAFQTSCGTAPNCNGGLPDAFVTVYNAAGTDYVYSTFLGGEGIDQGLGIAVDGAGDAYVTGLTQSLHFPSKSALYSTLDGTQDAFVTELNPTGTALVYSTFLGGSLSDAGTSIAVDGNKNAYVTGQTGSSDFPTASPTQGTLGGDNDAFVSEISPAGSQLLFSTYLGGTLNENTNSGGANLAAIGSIAVDNAGANIYVAGNTASTDFPKVAAEQSTYGGGTDAFVAMYTTIPDFTIAGTALTPVAQGGSTTSTITIAAVNGYTGTVNFTCSVAAVTGGTPLPTCSIPNAVTGGAGTSTLTVNTTGSAQASNRGANSLLYGMWLPVVGLSLVGLRYSTDGSRRKKILGVLLLGIMMTALFLLPACSSSNGGGGGGGGCSACTPGGTYTVTVTGTDSSNANLTHAVTPALTLTVNALLP
jgi:hypothetical protein